MTESSKAAQHQATRPWRHGGRCGGRGHSAIRCRAAGTGCRGPGKPEGGSTGSASPTERQSSKTAFWGITMAVARHFFFGVRLEPTIGCSETFPSGTNHEGRTCSPPEDFLVARQALAHTYADDLGGVTSAHLFCTM